MQTCSESFFRLDSEPWRVSVNPGGAAGTEWTMHSWHGGNVWQVESCPDPRSQTGHNVGCDRLLVWVAAQMGSRLVCAA